MKKTKWHWMTGALLRCAAGLSGGFFLLVVGLRTPLISEGAV